MSVSEDLHHLLEELRRTRSPLGRLRLIADAWKILRHTSSGQRGALAAELGVEGASEIVERLATARGLHLHGALLDALRRVRTADAGDMARVVGHLRDADGRRELVAEGLHAIEEHLVDDGRVDTPRPTATEHPAPIRQVPAGRSPGAPPEADDAHDRESLDEPARVAEIGGDADVAAVAASLPEPSASPPRRPTAPGRQERSPARPAPRVEPSAPEEPASRAENAAWMAQLATTARPGARLRALRTAEVDLAHLPTTTHERVVELFPDGWQRRRAVCSLLESGDVGLTSAIRAIHQLGGERDRVWCLSRLLRSRPMSRELRERCLELVSSEPARRRLQFAAEAAANDQARTEPRGREGESRPRR